MIKLENIEKKYDLGAVQVAALEGVNLSIERGEFLAVMGPSGSGKSTLLNVLGILDEPTGNLPSDMGEEVMKTLDELNSQGVTIVMVTHNDELGARAKRVVHIQDGHIQDGHTPDGNTAVAHGIIGELTGQSAEERRRA